MTKLGSGVTMMQAAQTLGYFASPLQLSKLMYHPNLNKYSRCKPIPYSGASPSTLAEWEIKADSMHWGLEMASVGQMNTDELMYGSAITLSKTDVWAYSGYTPTLDYPARLGSFRGYNTDAECPYLPVEFDTEYTPGVEGHYGPRFKLKWRLNDSQNVEINPYLYSNLHGTYHVLLKPESGKTGMSAVSSAVTETFTGMTSATITLQESEAGDYEACAAIKRGGGDGEIYPLPNTYFKFNVRNQSEEEYVGCTVTNMCSLRANSSTSKIYYTIKFRVTNITNSPIEIYAGCTLAGTNASRNPIWECSIPSVPTSSTPRFTVPANGSIYLYATSDSNQTLTTTDTGEMEHEESPSTYGIPITATCSIKNVSKADIAITKSKVVYGV